MINDKGKLSPLICTNWFLSYFFDPLKSVMSSLDLFHILFYYYFLFQNALHIYTLQRASNIKRIMIAETSHFIHIYFMIKKNYVVSEKDEQKCIKKITKILRVTNISSWSTLTSTSFPYNEKFSVEKFPSIKKQFFSEEVSFWVRSIADFINSFNESQKMNLFPCV